MLSKLKSVGKSENSSYIKIESSYIDFDEIEFALETFKSVRLDIDPMPETSSLIATSLRPLHLDILLILHQ